MSSYQNMQYAERVSMPDLYATVSSQSSTIVFPYIKNKFITLDYTDRVDILAKIKTERERLYSNDGRKTIIPEYYYWQGYETVDAEIKGVQLNKEGDVLALWTEFNDVYIYTRQGKQDNNRHSGLLTKFDEMVDYLLSDISEEEKSLRDTYFPAPWQLEMAIAPTKDTYGRTKVRKTKTQKEFYSEFMPSCNRLLDLFTFGTINIYVREKKYKKNKRH